MGGESDATDTFELLSSEVRVDILRALADASREDPTDPWVTYSDLRAAAGVEDKGNFNYHLDRLDGLFRTGPEGYAISAVGIDLVATIASGWLDPTWTWGPVDVPGECFFCSDSLALRYEDGALRLTCGTPDHALLFAVSPSLLEAHPEDGVTERVATVLVQQVALVRRGICPACQGPVTPAVQPEPYEPQQYYYFSGDCERCGIQHGFPVGAAVLPLPDVAAFCAERGLDVRATPYWTLEWCRLGHETVHSADPVRVGVDVTADGDTLSLTLDGEGGVVSSERD